MTPELRRGIDRIRDYLFGGGYPNPAQNAEQLSFLIYFYMFESADAARVRAAKRPSAAPYASVFSGEWGLRDPRNARESGAITVPRELLRWSSWADALNGERLVNWVREEVFAFHKELAANGATNFMDGARLVIDEPTVLTQVVSQLNDLRLDQVDADTKGDLFEHVLRQIRQAGELGQFRTPRHVIRALARLVDPRLGETIYDPAAGTAGFLAAAWDHIRLANSSPDGIEAIDAEGKTVQRGLGDMLSREAVRQLREATFFGADVDPQMVRLATMNLTLRGLDRVRILRRDALTRPLDRAAKAELGFPARGFDVILANPPFSGRLDKDRIVEDVKIGRTAQTELLFLQYMLNHLKEGGRCGVVVPEGVLFGSTGAHKELRRKLIESNTVEAVLSLPGGVFNPYAGVKTSALVFRKGGATGRVMFLHADNDGFKLDANHDQPIDEDDLPGLIEAFRDREARWRAWQERDAQADWTEKWWFADADAIRAADLNLSANRHRPQSRAKAEHRDPLEILGYLRGVQIEILSELDSLAHACAAGRTGVGAHPVFRLGDIANVAAGDPAPQEPAAFAPDGPLFVRMQDVGLHHVNPALADSADRLSEDWLAMNRLRLFPKDSILIPKSGASVNLNHRAKLAMEAHVVSHLAVVMPDKRRIDPDYLFWWAVRYDPRAQAQVTSLPSLKLSILKEAKVPLPPLDEQRRIVAILNRAAKIERMKKRAQLQLWEFITSVVHQYVR